MRFFGNIRTSGRSVALLALGAFLTCGGVALAQATLPSPNALGLYFDNEASTNNLSLAGPASVQAYLVFTDPTVASVTGWEVKITATSGTSVTGADLPVGTTALQAGPENWAAVLAEPMPGNTLTKLAIFTITTDASDNTLIYLGNIDSPSAPGDLPGVKLGDGSWVSLPVQSGDPSQPVAGINTALPTDVASWGDVKALFR
ncbi:hypothetical protein KDM41_15300 [bacterium]|nr:hypothetical protein [bacterium]